MLATIRLAALGLLAAATGLAGALLVLESVLRLWVGLATPNIMVFDPVLGWRHRPNVRRTYYNEGVAANVQTYAHGLRSALPTTLDPRPRVLVLGDSFVDGLEVSDDDHFVTRWARARPDLTIINAGIGGYGTIQETLWLDELLPIVKPSRLVLMVYANDLTDNVTPFDGGIGPRPYQRDEHVVPVGPASWEIVRPTLLPVPGAVWLHVHSQLAYLTRNRLLQTPWGNRVGEAASAAIQTVSEVEQRRVLSGAIARIAARGLPLTVIALPRKAALLGEAGPFTLAEAAVDLAEVLRANHFYLHDIHWNAAGHAAVAARLSQMPLLEAGE